MAGDGNCIAAYGAPVMGFPALTHMPPVHSTPGVAGVWAPGVGGRRAKPPPLAGTPRGLPLESPLGFTAKATADGTYKASLNFPNYREGPFVTFESAARPKGTSTKALVRCHGDFDTRHGGCVELSYSFISRRQYTGPAFVYFEGPFYSCKGALRSYKNWAQKVQRVS